MGYQLDFGALAGYLGLFLQGLGVTLGLTAIAASLGLALSIGGAATASRGRRWARIAVLAYVEAIRNTPFIVQMFFIFFGLPELGIKLSALQAKVEEILAGMKKDGSLNDMAVKWLKQPLAKDF